MCPPAHLAEQGHRSAVETLTLRKLNLNQLFSSSFVRLTELPGAARIPKMKRCPRIPISGLAKRALVDIAGNACALGFEDEIRTLILLRAAGSLLDVQPNR